MEDAKAWLTSGCASVVGVGAAAGTVPWWVAVVALTVGCGPQVRATLETVSTIAWQWKHPNCGCHTNGGHRTDSTDGPGAVADPTSGRGGPGDVEAALPPGEPSRRGRALNERWP